MRYFRQWFSPRISNGSHARSKGRRHAGAFEHLEQRTYLTGESFNVIGATDYYNNSAFSEFDGTGYAIAIIDNGFDLDHSIFGQDADLDDIGDRIVHQQDFANGDMDANHPTDGHGTHVASIVAEMLPGVDLILLKTIKDTGGSQQDFFYMHQALDWVFDNRTTYNIAAVNISLGEEEGFYTSPTTHETEPELYPIHDDLVNLAGAAIPVITAAGNHFFEEDSVQGVTFPAAHPLTIGVGATWDQSGGEVLWTQYYAFRGAEENTHAPDRIVSFSFRDEEMTEIFAPGAWLDGAWLDDGTSKQGGTSGSAPHVAAAAVLAQQLNDEFGYQVGKLDMDDLVELFQETGVEINDGDDEDDNVTNTGEDFRRLDVEAMAYKLFKPAAAPDLVFTSDWGFSETDNMTGDTTPTLTGTAPPNSHVWLYVDGTATANGQADGSGNFSLTSSVLTTGAKSITFKVAAASSVADANRSQASPAVSVTIVENETLTSSGTFNARLSETLVVPGTASAASEFAIAWSASAPERKLTKTGSGTVTIPAPMTNISVRNVTVTYEANGGTSIFNIDTGTAGIPGVSTRAANWTMNVDATAEFTTSQNLFALNILDDGLVEVVEAEEPPDYSVLYIGGPNETENKLDIVAGGLLDLANNGLVIDYSSSLTEMQVLAIENELRAWLIAGRGGSGVGNGDWDGTTGISSSTAAAWNATNAEARSIGYAVNATLPLGSETVFLGNSVDNSTFVVRYTVTGDFNLDGIVDDDDQTVIGATYAPGTPNAHWSYGDADYDGDVDDNDVTLFGSFWQEFLES
jgi:hypothetical protein